MDAEFSGDFLGRLTLPRTFENLRPCDRVDMGPRTFGGRVGDELTLNQELSRGGVSPFLNQLNERRPTFLDLPKSVLLLVDGVNDLITV